MGIRSTDELYINLGTEVISELGARDIAVKCLSS